MTKHSEWAEREWSRLQKLGKVSFFAKGTSKPRGLNVNPCGLILKLRPDAAQIDDETERYKARLVVDLTRGLVNPALPNIQVQYGTVERAVSRIRSGAFLYVLDLMDCFYIWRVLPSDSFMLGFYSEARQQFKPSTQTIKLRMCKSNDYRIQHVPSFSRLGHRLLGRRCKPNCPSHGCPLSIFSFLNCHFSGF